LKGSGDSKRQSRPNKTFNMDTLRPKKGRFNGFCESKALKTAKVALIIFF
jgi:hypothetical protein